MEIAVDSDDQNLLSAVRHLAYSLCQGGIYDHLGGGLMRYATDETWLVPHFEKMLYDNGQFIQLLALLYQLDKNHLANDDKLYHAYRAGQKKRAALLDDYANMIHAALSLYQATGEEGYLDHAVTWTHTVETYFSDPYGGYYKTNALSHDLIVRMKADPD